MEEEEKKRENKLLYKIFLFSLKEKGNNYSTFL
jgi:hypothetical protein